MIQTREFSVDGATYEVTQFSATKGMKMLTRLTKLLGEPMSVFMSGADVNMETALPVAVRALGERLEEDLVVDTVKQLFEGVRIVGMGSLEFDTHFSGKLGTMFKVLAKVLEVQYGDFFGVLGVKSIGQAKATTRKKTA